MIRTAKVKPRKKPVGRFHHGDLAEQLVLVAIELGEKTGHQAFSMKQLATRLGVFFLAIGVLVVSGLDKRVETIFVEASPQWLTDLTTRF